MSQQASSKSIELTIWIQNPLPCTLKRVGHHRIRVLFLAFMMLLVPSLYILFNSPSATMESWLYPLQSKTHNPTPLLNDPMLPLATSCVRFKLPTSLIMLKRSTRLLIRLWLLLNVPSMQPLTSPLEFLLLPWSSTSICFSTFLQSLICISFLQSAKLTDNWRRGYKNCNLGDEVLILAHIQSKMSARAEGTSTIAQVHVNSTVSIQRCPNLTEPINICHLKPYNRRV